MEMRRLIVVMLAGAGLGACLPPLPPPHGEGTARIDALRKVLRGK